MATVSQTLVVKLPPVQEDEGEAEPRHGRKVVESSDPAWPSEPYFGRKVGDVIADSHPTFAENPGEELARISAVIVGCSPEQGLVQVELQPSEIVVDFPAILFNPEMVKLGQALDYVVRARSDGFRAQHFEVRDPGPNPAKDQLLAMLSSIE